MRYRNWNLTNESLPKPFQYVLYSLETGVMGVGYIEKFGPMITWRTQSGNVIPNPPIYWILIPKLSKVKKT